MTLITVLSNQNKKELPRLTIDQIEAKQGTSLTAADIAGQLITGYQQPLMREWELLPKVPHPHIMDALFEVLWYAEFVENPNEADSEPAFMLQADHKPTREKIYYQFISQWSEKFQRIVGKEAHLMQSELHLIQPKYQWIHLFKGSVITVDQMECVQGGGYKMHFTVKGTGQKGVTDLYSPNQFYQSFVIPTSHEL